MPDASFLPDVSKRTKAYNASKALLWCLLFALIAGGAIGTYTILHKIERSNDRLLDCILPTGVCYKDKAYGINQESAAQVDVVVVWCATSQEYTNIEQLRDCVRTELRKQDERIYPEPLKPQG